MGSLQLSGFPLHPVLSGVISLFDRNGPTVSKISHWLRMSCRISERFPECKRVQRVIGHFIPVSVSDGYTKVPRVPISPKMVASSPSANGPDLSGPMCGSDVEAGWDLMGYSGTLGVSGSQGSSGDWMSFSSLFFSSLTRWSAPAIASEMRLSIDQSP